MEIKTSPTAMALSGLLQRKRACEHEPETVPPIVHEVLRSPGQSLDKETRDFFEPRFRHDFSRVRVHTDAIAAESARAADALAYTIGENVVFGVEQYEPGTMEGRRLLAHELTHVVQQRSKNFVTGATLQMGGQGDAYEQQAETIAVTVHTQGSSGIAVGGVAAAPLAMQRKAVDPGRQEPAEESECSGWQKDPESLSKVAAEYYVLTELGLVLAQITAGPKCDTSPLCCRETGGIAACTVEFTGGLRISVTIYPDRIEVYNQSNKAICIYDYTCPPAGRPILKKRKCF